MERVKKYDTKLIKPSDDKALMEAAEALRNGEVVAFPTETVYGLGGNASIGEAVNKIFEAKGRPADNPLIVHIFDKSQVDELALEVTPLARKLMDAFMPGPVTVIVKRNKEAVADEVTCGLDTVGIRMPSDKTCRKFLEYCRCPVAAPSANLSGSPSPTNARHVMNDMDGYVYGVIDGGESVVGLESTVIDATGEKPLILRPGAITLDMVMNAIEGEASYADVLVDGEAPKSPGMKYRHYAPNSEVIIIPLSDKVEVNETFVIPEPTEEEEDPLKLLDKETKLKMFDIAAPYVAKCREILTSNPIARIGIFAGDEVKLLFERIDDKVILSHVHFYPYGDACSPDKASHGLFDGLRHLDLQGVNYILAAGFPEEGIGRAYMNRLSKAALKKGDSNDEMNEAKELSRKCISIDDLPNVFTASVLFVCDDNKNLSAACEAIFRDILEKNEPFCLCSDTKTGAEIYAESAGLYAVDDEEADKKMIDAVAEITGRNLKAHRTQRVNPAIYDGNDLIIAMHDEQACEIVASFPEIKNRVFSISSYAASKGLVIKNEQGNVVSVSIPNPKGENKATYLHTVKALKAWLEILFPFILKDIGAELL